MRNGGRPSGGKGGDVFPCLIVGPLEHLVESGGAAFAVAGFLRGAGRDEVEERAVLGGFDEGALSGFQDQAAGFVEIDETGGGENRRLPGG